MSFDEVRLPTSVERGASGGPGFLTNVSLLNSGKEQRNSLWAVDRGRWDIGYGIQTRAEALAVRDFFYARKGRANGFRFRDWTNYTTGAVEMPAGDEADGVETDFQMKMTYTDSGFFTYTKDIFKPEAGSITVFIDGVSQGSGFTIDTTTGIISFSVAPAYQEVVTWTGDFDMAVRFDTDQLDMVVTNIEVIAAPSIPIVEIKL